ncbi:MAG: enoyl-CoA hydratase [Pseudomonadota bacterium]|jgi:enoyl-CoA hydratase/carnithine racemase|nr:enoyl-CoA hydratase [Pseudomonadota bacterium]QKK04552.1 MAG: enoyl-CoA hydratase [Pseudomonadota bacterium]
MTDLIKTSKKDGILTITMNRPEKKNALTTGMYSDMAKAIKDAGNDPDLRVILITGSQDAFCAGNDLLDFLNNPPQDDSSPVLQFLKTLSEAELPVVAAVNGTAVGIGTTMLLHCDFVYVAEDSTFSLPFINLGLVPEAGSSMLLPRLAGHQRAAELLMLGEPFTAEDAKEVGFVNRICKADDVLDTAMKTAEKLAKKPQNALRETKALMRQDFESVAARISREADVFKDCLTSEETKNAITTFFGRKKPGAPKSG